MTSEVESPALTNEVESLVPTRSGIARGLIVSVLILLFGGFGMVRMIKSRKKAKKKRPPAFTLRVHVQKAEKKDFPLYLEGYGSTQSLRTVRLAPEISGKVVYALPDLKPGKIVKKGQTLFRVDSQAFRLEARRLREQIKAVQIQLKLGLKALRLHKKDLARSRRLYKRRALALGAVDRQAMTVVDREQRLQGLRQSLAVNRVLLSRVNLNIRKSAVRAPFDAKISQGTVNRSDFVGAGRAILTLESAEAVEIPVAFSLQSLNKIVDAEGDPLDLQKLPAFLSDYEPALIQYPQQKNATWKGRVVRVGAKLSPSTRTINLWTRVQFASSKRKRKRRKRRRKSRKKGMKIELPMNKKTLLPGVFCSVKIPVRKLNQVVLIPRRALYSDNHVFLVKEKLVKGKKQKVLSKRKVGVVHQTNDQVYIGSGIENGEDIVISTLTDPFSGIPVVSSPANGH